MKYRNSPTVYSSPTVGEKRFASKWEAELCMMLDTLVRIGEIKTFLDEVPIPLSGATSDAGRRLCMRPDFMVIGNDGRVTFIDAKGAEPTQKWKLQRAMVSKLHGIDVIPIKRGEKLPGF